LGGGLRRTKSILKRAGSDGSSAGGATAASLSNGGGSGVLPAARTVSWNDAALEAVRVFERR
jgi:hypothetical protein